ncbi:CapA family protein [Lutibacter sp. B2]|nr:CapA family protein [Lutibacter sp. B2]
MLRVGFLKFILVLNLFLAATLFVNALETKEITFSFAGDCTMGWDETLSYKYSFPDKLKEVNNDYSYFLSNVKLIFKQDDVTLLNLETTFTDAKKKASKQFRFKGEPSYVNILKEGSVEMVNISNNHIYDYLTEGFDDTRKVLEENDILYSGEGHVAYYMKKDIKIASIGFRGFSTYIKDEVSKSIKKAKENADIVVVSFHWGKEGSNYPNQTQTTLGRFAIDQGADIVIGHHPHVIQGIEKYKDKYIVYSLGNFCFGGNRNPKDKDCFIFQIKYSLMENEEVQGDGKIIPCKISSVNYINDYRPTIVEKDEKERILNRIYIYSKKLEYGIQNKEKN